MNLIRDMGTKEIIGLKNDDNSKQFYCNSFIVLFFFLL